LLEWDSLPLSGLDVASQANQLEADLLAQAAGSHDQFEKADRVGVHLAVRWIEVDVPAGQALTIAGRADVLTVDPLTDPG
jgi:hypothetical protein